jgi:hypothetical protein
LYWTVEERSQGNRTRRIGNRDALSHMTLLSKPPLNLVWHATTHHSSLQSLSSFSIEEFIHPKRSLIILMLFFLLTPSQETYFIFPSMTPVFVPHPLSSTESVGFRELQLPCLGFFFVISDLRGICVCSTAHHFFLCMLSVALSGLSSYSYRAFSFSDLPSTYPYLAMNVTSPLDSVMCTVSSPYMTTTLSSISCVPPQLSGLSFLWDLSGMEVSRRSYTVKEPPILVNPSPPKEE